MDKEQARKNVQQLIERFKQIPERERARYNEAQMRHSFILPLFQSLGWDTTNPAEMTAEEHISRGFADFGFYLNGVPVFYVETKRPREDMNTHVKQAINYAWLKGITWAVLTNFEEVKVFNAEIKSINPLHDIFLNLHWENFTDADFDLLWLLSKESIQQGKIDEQAVRYGRMTRKEPVNQLLFAQLTEWRRELFKELKGFGDLFARDTQKLDEAVQRFLDRLIFIRTVEDRHLEQPRLLPLLRQYKENRKKGKNLFDDLRGLFQEMDEVYNARLFAQQQLDLLHMHNDILLERIINGLYNDKRGYGKYDFSAISADILGNIYEQYLSFKAADPEGQQAVTEKQTKRKAQGIYYTPHFVVRYIVRQTLGKLLDEGADPYKIRVLDPACGSGSFLIEAFDVLDRHLAKHGTGDHQQHPRKRRLHILQHHLYGVDLDPQAVEVAQLNLLLRAAVERGRLDTLQHIKVGNSLIDDPAVAGDHALNWHETFPDVMADGGFDVIIGNPPYVRQETLGAAFKTYAQNCYETYAGTADLYVYFIEKAHTLLRENGRFGMITSNKFMRANYGKALRKFLAEKTTLQQIIDFGELPVFQDAATFPVIITTINNTVQNQKFIYAPIKNLKFPSLNDEISRISLTLDSLAIGENEWTLTNTSELTIFDKMKQIGVSLGEYVNKKIFWGVKTGLNEAFVIDAHLREKIIQREPQSSPFIVPHIVGDEVRKYHIRFSKKYLIYIKSGWTDENSKGITNKWDWFKVNFPYLAEYLQPFEQAATKRYDKGQYWWELRSCDYYDAFTKPKIVYPEIAKESRFTLDEEGFFSNNKTYIIPTSDTYLLGVLNSKLIWAYLKRHCSVIGDPDRGGRLELKTIYMSKLPIRKIDVENPDDVAKHQQMVGLVEEMLRLKAQHAESALDDRRYELADKIARTDAAIDALVYALYGLTEAEIAVVAGK